MRRSRRQHGSGEGGHVNVVPLIDIVMVLIIFYLMVGTFIETDYTDIDLPMSVAGAPTAGAEVFTVTIAPREGAGGVAGVYRVQGVEVDAGTIEREVRRAAAREPELRVQLRASRELPYGAVEPAVRAVARAGVARVRLVTEPAS